MYFVLLSSISQAQCTIVTTCGYNVGITLKTLSVVLGSNPCPNGFNYNLRFTYTITVTGINTCYNGNIGIQPQIFCNSQSNGYYTINVAAPNVGAIASSAAYTGTLTTTTNPFIGTPTCNSATPASLNCNSAQVTIFGPGIPTQTILCSLSTLPIELLYFKGQCEGSYAKLGWSTATETNNKYFTVEKSEDAFNWNESGIIAGAGNSTEVKTYTFSDDDTETKSEVAYYRLKQTDFNGTYKYSNVISVERCGMNTKADLVIYPNPANESIHLKLKDDQSSYAVKVFGPLGNEVYSSDSFQPVIDLSGFSKGIYVVHVFNTASSMIRKIVVEK